VLDLCADPRGFTAKVNRELRRLWEQSIGFRPNAAPLISAIDQKIAHIRQAVEEGLNDAMWANGRLSELARERASSPRVYRRCCGVGSDASGQINGVCGNWTSAFHNEWKVEGKRPYRNVDVGSEHGKVCFTRRTERGHESGRGGCHQPRCHEARVATASGRCRSGRIVNSRTETVSRSTT
jgi:hypothetical protein